MIKYIFILCGCMIAVSIAVLIYCPSPSANIAVVVLDRSVVKQKARAVQKQTITDLLPRKVEMIHGLGDGD